MKFTQNPILSTFNPHFTTAKWKIICLLIPTLIAHICWWSYMISNQRFSIFQTTIGPHNTPVYDMSITMIFGSFIAGASSEGGAAVAFPVLTLGFDVSPSEARDFSFMIQSCGMSAATLTILLMGVIIDHKTLFFCSIGGAVGVIFGLEFISSNLTAAESKMFFVSIWSSFAICLYYFNIHYSNSEEDFHLSIPFKWIPKIGHSTAEEAGICPERKSYPACEMNSSMSFGSAGNIQRTMSEDEKLMTLLSSISNRPSQQLTTPRNSERKSISIPYGLRSFQSQGLIVHSILLLTGFIGGIFSAMTGAGLDICAFSILTLLFGVNEKVATPTSVVLMALNSIIAFLWRNYKMKAIAPETWSIWLCCVPFVTVFAPIGAFLSSYFHRSLLAFLICLIDFVQLLAALIIIQPWSTKDTNHPEILSSLSAVLFLLSLFLFVGIRYLGLELHHRFSAIHSAKILLAHRNHKKALGIFLGDKESSKIQGEESKASSFTFQDTDPSIHSNPMSTSHNSLSSSNSNTRAERNSSAIC